MYAKIEFFLNNLLGSFILSELGSNKCVDTEIVFKFLVLLSLIVVRCFQVHYIYEIYGIKPSILSRNLKNGRNWC